MRTQPLGVRRALDALGIIACTALAAFVLAGLGLMLDQARDAIGAQPAYHSYGLRPADPITLAAEASRAADQQQCVDVHGPHATALQLPDGSHRCLDKHGRRLARSSITIPAHRLAQVAP